MFDNLNWWEIGALLVLALLIFGDKLPNVISDGLRMLRNLRAMANNATSDLSRELGTDIQLADLHPKNFIRKHLLSEEDEATLRRPLESLQKDLKEVAQAADLKTAPGRTGSARPGPANAGSARTGQGRSSAAVPEPSPAAGPPAEPPARHSGFYDIDAT
jgi:sec-independent protein translocase protein TatB